MRSAVLAGALMALAGCGETPKEPPPVVPAAAPPSLARAERSVAYRCEKDLPVTAIYGTDAQGQPDVALIINGQDLRLAQTVAASGARYASAQGLEPGMGVVWWEKGGTAQLQQVPSAKIDDYGAAQTIRTCKVKDEQGPAPAPPPQAAANS